MISIAGIRLVVVSLARAVVGRCNISKKQRRYRNIMFKQPQTSSSARRHLPLLGSACAVALIPLTLACQGAVGAAKATPAAKSHAVLIGIDPLWATKGSKAISADIAGMKAAGINSVRIDANWKWVQPKGPKSFSWSHLDEEVRLASAARMTIDLIIDDCPYWAAARIAKHSPDWRQPGSARQYATFAAQVAKRYAKEGVHLFEIWNEPNDSKFFQPKANAPVYTRMLVAAYRAIKKVDKSAFVISGGMAPIIRHRFGRVGSINPISFLRAMYAHGAKGHFDALGDHPYTFPTLPNTFKRSSWWSQMALTRPSLRSIMASHHDSGKRIWLTEYGAPTNGPKGVGQKAQAAELKQAIIDARTKSWIGALYIYTWKDLGADRRVTGDWFGLLTVKGKRKSAYYAVVSAIKQRVR